MSAQIFTLSLLWRMAIPFALAGIFLRGSFTWSKKERTVAADVFRIPISNVLSVLGLIFPILLGLLAYLFSQDSRQPFNYLISAIGTLLLTLLVAIYQTFAVANKASKNGEVSLSATQSVWHMAGLGAMYSFLLTGIVYTVLFVTVEMKGKGPENNSVDRGPFIAHRPIHVGQAVADVRSSWGEPELSTNGGKTLRFSTPSSKIQVDFDDALTVRQIIEVAKGN